VIYFILFLLLSAFSAASYSVIPTRLICVFVGFVLATFAAIRGPDVASDFMVYQDWYGRREVETGFLERPGYFEALYFLLNDIFVAAGIKFRVFVGFLALSAVFIKLKVILSFAGNSRAAGIGILIYANTFYLLHEFTQIRAGLAVAFIFLAVQSLVNERRTVFVLWVVVAAGFHSSAVMAFLLMFSYRGARARWIDSGLMFATGSVYILAIGGFSIGESLVGMLTTLDTRLDFYVSLTEGGQSEVANPFAASALLVLALALSLSSTGWTRLQSNILDARNVIAIVLVRRSILIGVTCLVSLTSLPALALRLFEIEIALLPILVVIIFSQRKWYLQKSIILCWVLVVSYLYIAREDGLVGPYVLSFL
jgi:hypothetical protein